MVSFNSIEGFSIDRLLSTVYKAVAAREREITGGQFAIFTINVVQHTENT